MREVCGFLCMIGAVVLSVPGAARAQLAHLGPAGMIKLSQTLPTYDVSTVRVNESGADNFGMGISDTNGTMTATNTPVEMMIEYAYDVKLDHIFGLTGPVKDAHFDVKAKVLEDSNSPKLTDQQLQAMLIPLLASRFHLRAHIEQRTLPVYDLVVDHGGPKIKLAMDASKDGSINWTGTDADRVLTATSASIPDLARILSDIVHREVIDKTGLEGRTTMTLKWTDDEAAEQGGTVLSIFTALEEQLGLKLVSSKGPVDTLVIDHIEMPTQN